MVEATRKKSPRFPTVTLEDSLEKALKIYEKEMTYDVDVNTAARHAGYKDATSGASIQVLASLGYYGLIIKRGDGTVAVAPEVREFRNTPNEQEKKNLLVKWLKAPNIFRELLEDDYPQGLPSDQNVRYALTKKGFTDKGADECVKVFKKSVEFVDYYQHVQVSGDYIEDLSPNLPVFQTTAPDTYETPLPVRDEGGQSEHDEIPVRLGNGRRAWLRIPTPFFEKDKERLKKQIDLIMTEDEDDL